jgi:D-alanine--poly(phosphoribitol) ligase subunit 2
MQHEYDQVRAVLASFITTELMRRPSYPLRDDEAMVTGGLIDSMAFVQIAMYVEERFGVSIPDDDLTVERADTLGQIVARVLKG